MISDRQLSKVFFYTTSPLTCPYIDNQVERRIVTELSGDDVNQLHSQLSKSGFRRSHYMAYLPACPNCNACIPVRVKINDFVFRKSFKRTISNFKHVTAEVLPAKATQEQFILFEKYQQKRHSDGDMALMDYFDYRSMIEETPVHTHVVEFRVEGNLIGVVLLDQLEDGFSAVYSFFSVHDDYNGFGTFIVLWVIMKAMEVNFPYVYLGYLIKSCPKMSYKKRFTPLEACIEGCWLPYNV